MMWNGFLRFGRLNHFGPICEPLKVLQQQLQRNPRSSDKFVCKNAEVIIQTKAY